MIRRSPISTTPTSLRAGATADMGETYGWVLRPMEVAFRVVKAHVLGPPGAPPEVPRQGAHLSESLGCADGHDSSTRLRTGLLGYLRSEDSRLSGRERVDE